MIDYLEIAKEAAGVAEGIEDEDDFAKVGTGQATLAASYALIAIAERLDALIGTERQPTKAKSCEHSLPAGCCAICAADRKRRETPQEDGLHLHQSTRDKEMEAFIRQQPREMREAYRTYVPDCCCAVCIAKRKAQEVAS